jgi:hypothetical protein
MIEWFGGSDDAAVGLMSLIALVIVWVPFQLAARLCLAARRATRRVERADLPRDPLRRTIERGEPLASLLHGVLARSLRARDAGSWPPEFVVDAARQYVHNEYEAAYARPISMYASLLPPLGIVGTTIGMALLILSRQGSNETLELAALALALTKTIFALIGYAILEGWKINLSSRLSRALDDVVALHLAAPPPPRVAAEAARPAAASAI